MRLALPRLRINNPHCLAPPRGSDGTDSAAGLLRRLQAGEEAAFAEVIRRYGPRMLATCRRILGDEAGAEDSVQEAFLNAFRNLDGFESRAALGTWLQRIAINAALVRRRSGSRRPEGSIEDLLPGFDEFGLRIEPPWSEPPASPEDEAARNEERALVRARIEELPADYRAILVLRDVEERATAEVAELLGIGEGAVKMRLHRARAALKTLLERDAPAAAVQSSP